jgi:hypothetical protein
MLTDYTTVMHGGTITGTITGAVDPSCDHLAQFPSTIAGCRPLFAHMQG